MLQLTMQVWLGGAFYFSTYSDRETFLRKKLQIKTILPQE